MAEAASKILSKTQLNVIGSTGSTKINKPRMKKKLPNATTTVGNTNQQKQAVNSNGDDGLKCEKVEKEIVPQQPENSEKSQQTAEVEKESFDLSKSKIFLTEIEKRRLEEITALAAKPRVPLDDRQMQYFQKDLQKFEVDHQIPVKLNVSDKELKEASIKLKDPKVMATDLSAMMSYLLSLKELIAKRESSWAEATEKEYSQKAEIARLKTEIEHLRVMCGKRQNEINEKDKELASKEEELAKLRPLVSKLKTRIIQMEKARDDFDNPGSDKKGVTSSTGNQARVNLQQREEMLLNKKAIAGSQLEYRKNQGPAAMIANALYRARNAGSFVNF